MSLVRESKPKGLYVKDYGFSLINPYSGIYYVEEKILFPTQIIVIKELDMDTHTWRRGLSWNVRKRVSLRLFERMKGR